MDHFIYIVVRGIYDFEPQLRFALYNIDKTAKATWSKTYFHEPSLLQYTCYEIKVQSNFHQTCGCIKLYENLAHLLNSSNCRFLFNDDDNFYLAYQHQSAGVYHPQSLNKLSFSAIENRFF